jgi:fumarate hydratase class I
MKAFQERMYELIVRTSTTLPADALQALARARAAESEGSRDAIANAAIAINIDMAVDGTAPVCQDTGMPTFVVRHPIGFDTLQAAEQIKLALRRATKAGIMRPNSVDSITGVNEGNEGTLYPVIKFEAWTEPRLHVSLVLKGGGSENMAAQYSLPATLEGLGKAGRDMDGVRKCILHALYTAQGKGCSPGFLGVGIGGDRTGSYELAKKQLLRPLDDENPDPVLAKLEDMIVEQGNTLGVGTLGFGGETTVLSCKAGKRNRLPASFFVSVMYNCWAFRRQGMSIALDGFDQLGWDYLRPEAPTSLLKPGEEGGLGGEGSPVKRLKIPLSEADARALKVGDVVLLSGMIHTGRDTFHHHHMSHDAPVETEGGVIYHCGPVMLKQDGKWRVMAAGPTTSIREEPYQAEINRKLGLRAVIGKGGMGAKTLQGLADHGAVYLNAVGGAAQYCAQCVVDVPGVHYLEEFGVPEAMWHFEVVDFPAFVTMDSHGNSLHADVDKSSFEKLRALVDKSF